MNNSQQNGLYRQDLLCPHCSSQGEQHKGKEKDGSWLCGHCSHAFSLQILCPTCNQHVERMQSCGGREEYFCKHCRSQKARRSVNYVLQAQ